MQRAFEDKSTEVESEWLDDWLCEPSVRTVRTRSARASADGLWSAALTVRLRDTGRLGPLVRWRIPGVSSQITYRDMLRKPPFTLLAEGSYYSLSGLCGRIWTLKRDYAPINDARDFASFDEPGTVRVLFAHWVRAVGNQEAVLVSESRVKPVDKSAALRLRALWAIVGIFEPLIATEPLALAASIAESGRDGRS